MFWPPATAAAGTATAFSTATVLWLRKHERPESDFVTTAVAGWPEIQHSPGEYIEVLYIRGELINSGDGDAYQVTIAASGDRCGFGAADSLEPNNPATLPDVAMAARIQAGESKLWWARVAPDNWRNIVMTIEWTPPPTRLKKRRSLSWPLPDLTDVPPDRRGK